MILMKLHFEIRIANIVQSKNDCFGDHLRKPFKNKMLIK